MFEVLLTSFNSGYDFPTHQSAPYYDVATFATGGSLRDEKQETISLTELAWEKSDLNFKDLDLSSLSARVVYELGSCVTKIKGAVFNTHTNQISAVFCEYSFPMCYSIDLAQSQDNTFSDLIMDIGILKLEEYKRKVQKDFNKLNLNLVLEHYGVATEAFRKAKNSFDYTQRIEDKLGIQIEIMTQHEEGMLGFEGVKMALHSNDQSTFDFSPPIVWDIGSRSMQLTGQDPQGNFFVMQGALASESFYTLVAQQVKHFYKESHSPNPLAQNEFEAAIALAKEFLQFDQTETQKISEQLAMGRKVIAIGQVHHESLLNAVQKVFQTTQNHYTKEQVLLCAKLLSELSDDQIAVKLHLKNPSHCASQVTDLILAYALMDKYNIHSVDTLQLDNTQALLTRST